MQYEVRFSSILVHRGILSARCGIRGLCYPNQTMGGMGDHYAVYIFSKKIESKAMETPPTTPVSLFSRGWAAVTGRKKKGKRHGLQIRSVPNNAHSCRQYMQLILISWCCNIYPPQLLLQLIRYPAAKLPTPNIKQCHLQSTGVGGSSCSCVSILIF